MAVAAYEQWLETDDADLGGPLDTAARRDVAPLRWTADTWYGDLPGRALLRTRRLCSVEGSS